MKRILALLAILFISSSFVFAQEDGSDFSTLLEDINNDDTFRDTDLTDFQGSMTDEDLATLRSDLEAEGDYTPEQIDALVGAAEDVNDGTAGTVGQLLDNNPELEDAVIDIIAAQAVDSLFSGDEQQEMEDTLAMLKGLLNLLGGFGQATANSSVSSTLMGYQGYDLFALSIGGTVAMSPGLDTIMDIMEVQSEAAEDQFIDELNALDVTAGVAVQSFVLNFGINTSFLVDGLYLGAVIGSSSVEMTSDTLTAKALGMPIVNEVAISDSSEEPGQAGEEAGVSFEASMSAATYGIRAYYQVIDPFNIPILLRWNGLNVGTGFIYNSFNVDAKADMSSELGLPENTLGVEFGIDNATYTIPLEVSTGIRLLSALNLSVGAGVDLQFGESNVGFDLIRSGEESLSEQLLTSILNEVLERGGMSFPYNETYQPDFLNPRVQAGMGLGIGPLTLLDVTATYYVTTGFALGANIIFRW